MSVGASGVLVGLSKGLGGKSRRHLPDVEAHRRFSRSDQLLISAARDGDTSLVLELLGCTHTVNINARDRKSGSTALCIASAWGHGKIVRLLLDYGADPTLHNFEGRSALEVAATTEISLLLLNCLPKSSSPSTLLQQVAWQGNVQLVEQVLSNGDVDLEACNNEGLNPLLLSARDIKVFHALFQQNLLNSYDPSEVSNHLLNSGVNIFHQDQQGRTALHYSVTYVSEIAIKLTKLLIQFNADTNAVDKHSFTPLHFAVKSKSLEATEILLKSGCNVNQTTYAGHTALHIAASHGDVKLAALLLNHGAGVTSVTHSGLSPLKCAANREMYSLLKAAIGASVIESSQQLSECQHHLHGQHDRLFQEEVDDGKDGGKCCRKSRNGRKHKTTSSVKKQLLFTMHLGLAVSKSPNGNENPPTITQGNKESTPSKPGIPGLPPSRIPVTIAKFGSGEIKGSRPVSPLRSRSCTNCDGLSLPVDAFDESKGDIHSDSSEEAKVSSVPDVLRSTSNLPLCGKNIRRHRRYVNANDTPSGQLANEASRFGKREFHTRLPHQSPNRKNPTSIHCREDSHLMADGKKLQNLFLILGNQAQKSENNLTVADYQKMKKYPDYIPSKNDLMNSSKPSVHFLIDSKQTNNSGSRHRQRHKHPYAVSVKAYGKRIKNKPAKSDSEVETKSVSPIKGQSMNLFTSNKSSKLVSRLPKKCKEPSHLKDDENDLVKGALLGQKNSKFSMSKVVDQFRAISLQVTPSESNSTLDASISSDCVSQVSAASWIYVPNEDTPKFGRTHVPPSTLPGLSSENSSISNNDLRGSSFWKDSEVVTPTICEDDILIEDESPEHLYDCPLTPPPSLKHHQDAEVCCQLDSQCDMFNWSSTGSTPVGTIVPTVEHSQTNCIKLYEGKTSEECLAILQGESESQLSISWAKGKLLGKGAFGLVWCGMTSEGDLIAVKQVKLNSTNAPEAAEEYLQIQREFQMLQRLQHRNIVSYLGTKLEGTTVSIFMQYIAGGSITNNLNQFGAFAESVICRYSKQILEGIEYLHSNGIVHRDIKGANIMVMPSETGGLIKLIDFGCAKHLHMSVQESNHYIQSVRGTPYWMAPEVIQQSSACTEKSDIWSVGCTVIEMATTKPPWHELPPFSAAYAIGEGTSKPKIPTNLTPIARDFIGSAMRRNPEARPRASDLLKHTFLEEAVYTGSLKQSD